MQAQAAQRAAADAARWAGLEAVLGGESDGFSCSQADVPEAFTRELLGVGGLDGLRCDPGLRLVGYECQGTADEALGEVRRALEGRGWCAIVSDGAACATFTKDTGACRWAFAACVQTGQRTSVVVQWSQDGKEGPS